MELKDVYTNDLQAQMLARAKHAGLADPEDTVQRAITRWQDRVEDGYLTGDRESLFLVLSGMVRDELGSARHRMEFPVPGGQLLAWERKGVGQPVLHSTSAPTTDDQLFRTSLAGALSNMVPRRAKAWVLREMRGLTFEECGVLLGVSKQRAAQLCEEARVQLTEEVYRA